MALGLLGLLNIVPCLGSIVGIITAFLVAYLQLEYRGERTVVSFIRLWDILCNCPSYESYFLTLKLWDNKRDFTQLLLYRFFLGNRTGWNTWYDFGIPLTAFLIVAWRLLVENI